MARLRHITVICVIGMVARSPFDPAYGLQDKPEPAHPTVDQEKVDRAIQDGCRYLLSAADLYTSFGHGRRHQAEAMQAYGELVLLTLAHSGYYKDGSAEIARLIEHVLQKPIATTYTASLMAMALQKLDSRKYQWRIAQCAQFLVDNQCTNGQWDYGEPVPVDKFRPPMPTTAPKPPQDVATQSSGRSSPTTAAEPKKKEAGRTSPLPRVPVQKRKNGPPNGDNSNAQYAALGLRACLDAGIDVEISVLARARQWWLRSQNRDGGWGYCDCGSTGGGEENEKSVSNSSYGSMTVGAVGALCIYDYFLKMDYKNDPAVKSGVAWIAANYEVTRNPKKTNFAVLYYLYGLERVGLLYGTEKFGANEWYPDGANHLLQTQQGGTWNSGDRLVKGAAQTTVDTCFAILFLRRGTPRLKPPPPPVATQGGGSAPPPPGASVPNPGTR